MTENLIEQITFNASFVSGLKAWFRDENDEFMKSAIEDAHQLLQSLPENCQKPVIEGATTFEPRIIVSLYWSVIESNMMSKVCVKLLGKGAHIVEWCVKSGETHQLELSLQELLSSNLAFVNKIITIVDTKSAIHENQAV